MFSRLSSIVMSARYWRIMLSFVCCYSLSFGCAGNSSQPNNADSANTVMIDTSARPSQNQSSSSSNKTVNPPKPSEKQSASSFPPCPADFHPTDADTKNAKSLFALGTQNYSEQQFETAAMLFKQSYALSCKSTLLYNLAQALIQSGNKPAASEALRELMRKATPEDPIRDQAQELIEKYRL